MISLILLISSFHGVWYHLNIFYMFTGDVCGDSSVFCQSS